MPDRGEEKAGWGERIERGILLYPSRVGRRVPLEEIGEMVAELEGREKRYEKGTVSAWTSETNEPTLSTFEALAKLLGGDAWWYAWGVGTPPDNPAAKFLLPTDRPFRRRKAK